MAVLFLLGARPAADPPISATAVLGAVVTTTVTIDNSGQPALTAQLYEAWDAPTTPTPAPPGLAPARVPLPKAPGPITQELLDQLAAAPDGQADMILYLSDQVDLSAVALTQ
ncbi:MAG: hypothetical protein ACRDH2_13405, partial [Anaerolineales bacterium]